MAAKRVVWTPQPKQRAFMSRGEYEVLFGGAAGGGKSDAMVMEALRQVHIPHYKALILRKTFPQLSELIDKSLNYYPRAFPRARYNASARQWTFPSGAKVLFGAMHRTADRHKYQGKAFDFVGFDELTHFTYDEYSYMFSRNRANGPGTRVYMRATANPGGVGHGWVKQRFITAQKPMTPVIQQVRVRYPDGSEQMHKRKRIFVPSSVFDNDALMHNDPDYIARLAMLPEAERQALLYGDWNTFSGQVFVEWRDEPEHYSDRVNTHVIAPFAVPRDWSIYRSFDFGYARPFAVGWYAVDYDRRVYLIKELYGCTGDPDVGVRWEPSHIAEQIRLIEAEEPNLKGRRIQGIADPSIYDESRGESVARMMERGGIWFEPADNARIAGKMQVHNRLRFDDNGIPMFYAFNTCTDFIRTVPALVYDERRVEDVDTTQEDHHYDQLRYILMEHPYTPPPKRAPELVVFDPFADDGTAYDPYAFYRRV